MESLKYKITNPHLKSKQIKHSTAKEKQDDIKLNAESKKVISTDTPSKKLVIYEDDKHSILRDALKDGFIDSYVDLFYLLSRKTPDLKLKYQEEHKIENTETRTLSYKYPLKDLVEIKKLLIKSEQNLRDGIINKENKSIRDDNISSAIETYSEIANLVFHSDLYASIYFVQKGIILSVRYDLSKYIIQTLILMGKRFDNTYNSSDYEISKKFKEDAQKLFEKLEIRDPLLEFSIYENLINIYNEISIKKEYQSNYEDSITCLRNQSTNIVKLLEIVKEHLNDDKKEKFYLEQQIVVNLKIANLNFKLKNYSETLEYLQHLDNLIDSNIDPINYLYALTYEAQDNYLKAIECLDIIERKEIGISTEDDINAKALLNLGRLHFKQNNFEQSYKHLKSFFRKCKTNENKELLDIGRVNLGMIKGTQGMKEYIEMIKNSNHKIFLKSKLNFFSDLN